MSSVLASYSMYLNNPATVPPAELENVLLEHPEVADSGVIGVVIDGLELPRYVNPCWTGVVDTKPFASRGYITLKKPTTDVAVQRRIALEVQEWIKGKVGHPKYLRGGVIVVSEIPRR